MIMRNHVSRERLAFCPEGGTTGKLMGGQNGNGLSSGEQEGAGPLQQTDCRCPAEGAHVTQNRLVPVKWQVLANKC